MFVQMFGRQQRRPDLFWRDMLGRVDQMLSKHNSQAATDYLTNYRRILHMRIIKWQLEHFDRG